jgi:hypothetical protein
MLTKRQHGYPQYTLVCDARRRAAGPIHSSEQSLLFARAEVSQDRPTFRGNLTKEGPTVIKKFLATAAVAVSIAGVSATVAPSAMAIGDDHGTTTANGNGSEQSYGNTYTSGYMSPSFALIQGSLNKPCIALPAKANLGSLVGVVPVTVQDINVLSSPQNQQCTENSTQAKGDEPLSHILDDIPVLSGNGAGNH